MEIKEVRMQLGLSAADVTRIIGVSKRKLQDREAGKRTPSDYVERLIIEKLQNIDLEKYKTDRKNKCND